MSSNLVRRMFVFFVDTLNGIKRLLTVRLQSIPISFQLISELLICYTSHADTKGSLRKVDYYKCIVIVEKVIKIK